MTSPVPVKTQQGQEELAHRVRKLGQRHRTLLLLIDGRRTLAQVQQLANAAGVPPDCLDELMAQGLVELTSPSAGSSDINLIELDLPLPHDDSLLPAADSLAAESDLGTSGMAELDLPPLPTADPQLEEAREMLMRAVRNEAPVTGSLTLMKLKRATSRDDLAALLDEVDLRIRKPRKQIIAAQLIRQVKHLLSLPPLAP